ncbi:MAG TPA: carbon-nitrogen hydrolase family protein [Bacteroidia bacterium]|nr:carbon-nitrogen hydrolase family protein [Bacteroidia bacterium]
MILAAAQINPFRNNTAANIQRHLQFIERAAENNAQLILFPEMSLSGYERELADGLSFTLDDERLNILSEKAKQHQMLIIVGAPVKIKNRLYIGAFIFAGDQTLRVYTKQFLHTGEEKYFSAGAHHNPILELEKEIISVAICADITNDRHAAKAAKNKTSLYLAGIFYTPGGMDKGFETLSGYSKKHSMKVLMANYCGSSYDMPGGGQSAFWDEKGVLKGQLDASSEGLLLVEYKDKNWHTRKVSVGPH